jgi:adenylate cyclase
LTVLFADIQGFTGFSEQLEPEELTNFLNKFLTVMTHRIFDHQGTVDKYIGDAIMAIFGAPIPFEDHAVKGVEAALGMREELENTKKEWQNTLPATFDLKLGLNTGPMVVGNMGSDVRFDYTVLGDNVNLAARLEALTRQYGVGLLISKSTRDPLGDDFLVREIDAVRVKGKKKPVRTFEVLAKVGTEKDTVELRRLIDDFTLGLESYRAQKWDEAQKIFNSLGEDPASVVFSGRCDLLRDEPPAEDWDGVWIMTTK